MSQTNYDTDVISWSIDREPDYNILHYLADYRIANSDDDFIPFNEINRQNKSRIEYIIEPFVLTKEDKNCCVCMEERENEQMCRLNCKHIFCVYCMNQHLNKNNCCPLCRTCIKSIQTQTVESKNQINH